MFCCIMVALCVGVCKLSESGSNPRVLLLCSHSESLEGWLKCALCCSNGASVLRV
jgi:hypothetical protein